MKNKIIFSLALAIAANACIATPAMAFDWKRAAKITGKTAFGLVTIGTSAMVPFLYGAATAETLQKVGNISFKNLLSAASTNAVEIALALTTSAISCYAGFKVLESVWNDFKPKKVTNPLITKFEKGKITVESNGFRYVFKDCKLSPKRIENWDWNEFDTKHEPGIQIQDLQSIIDDCDIIILSQGIDQRLQIPQETKDYLYQQEKEVYTLQSEAAVTFYNLCVKNKEQVGILLHSC